MFKFLTKADSWLDVAWRWGTAFAAVWAGLSWLAKKMTALGNLNWAESIFIGLGAAVILSFALSFGLIAFRYFRPLAPVSPSSVDAVITAARDPDAMAKFTAIDERFAHLEAKAEQIRVDTAIVSQDLQRLDKKVASKDERVLGSFYALGVRERLASLEVDIRRDAADLYDRLRGGETYDLQQWQQWENVHNHWEEALKTWLDNARWYAEKVVGGTLTVDDAKYRLEWTVRDDQFPNAEAVRQFKKFRIIHTQWLEILPKVEQGLLKVAFSGMSELDVRNGNAAG